MADLALKYRWMFIEHKAAEKMGLFGAEPKFKDVDEMKKATAEPETTHAEKEES